MSCWEGIKDGWYGRSWLLRSVTGMLLLSIVLLVLSIMCPFWAIILTEEDSVKNVGVFGYLFRSDLNVPQDAVPFLYAVLALISFIVLLCDVILDVMFVTKNFYLVVPTVIVFSFIAGCMTSVIVILWAIGHSHVSSTLSWAFYFAVLSAALDFLAAVVSCVEFCRHGGGPTWRWDSTVRLATETLEREDAAVQGLRSQEGVEMMSEHAV